LTNVLHKQILAKDSVRVTTLVCLSCQSAISCQRT